MTPQAQVSIHKSMTGLDCGISAYRYIIYTMLYVNLALALIAALFLQSTVPLFHLISCIQICNIQVINKF